MSLSEQSTAKKIKQSNFALQLINELFQVLNDKEKEVITKRFAINLEKKYTLEEIGKKHNITRERVRQIEKAALTKLKRVVLNTSFDELIKIIDTVLKEESYIATEEKLVQIIINKTTNLFIKNESIIILALSINKNIEPIKKTKYNHKTWFNKEKLNKNKVLKTIKLAIKTLKENKKIIPEAEFQTTLFEQTKKAKISINKSAIKNILESSCLLKLVNEGYGLSSWRSVNPKSIKDKALIVLSRENKPLHFRRISRLIHQNDLNTKKVTIQAVHNELIRYDEFVLVGRGIYALKKWGYTQGTVKEVIYEILKEKGPLKKSEIVNEVLKRRQVKIGTISLNLQKYPEFKRIGRAIYTV